MPNEEMGQPPQQNADAGEGDGAEGAAGSAEGAIKQIQSGFQSLAKLLQQAGGGVSPQDVKLFQQAMSATDDFIQSISGPGEEGPPPPPQRAPQSGPMAAHANAGARPVGY